MKKLIMLIAILLFVATTLAQNALVFQSDFGVRDAAVASMKGVAFAVSPDLKMFDLTHEIPAYNVWEAAQRLSQTAAYWPSGTVFVSVVDPGVGTARKSVVLKTKSGHYFVSPDKGTLTLVAEELGIAAVREIDEAVNRLQGSEKSYTFHGRDVYAYTGARLAAGIITFAEVGNKLKNRVLSLAYQKARFDNGAVFGNIPILDPQYGNIWTNIDRATFTKLNVKPGDKLKVKITQGEKRALEVSLPYWATFGSVKIGAPLLYLNSLSNLSLAINQGNFAMQYGIQSGADWNIEVCK